jgi:hypothetical protein
MTLTLPDSPALQALPADELRLDLACVMYARGQIGKVEGARMAGVDFFTFQSRLGELGLGGYSEDMVIEDLATIAGLAGK